MTPRVRLTARPCSFDALTKGQQNALLQAAGLLAEMASYKAADPEKLPLFVPRIVHDRRSHVVLLDGARGSGKTTALITLLDACVASFRDPPGFKTGSGDLDKLLQNAALVPVGMVDLRPLPDKTNLVIHIAAQLRRVVDFLAEHGGALGESAAPWHPERESALQSPGKWEKFLGAAALGWDGSTSDRRARIDPEAYILELKDEELYRLDIPARYTSFLDALTADFKQVYRKLGKEPLFVIPIDDADMNPRRSAELLKVVSALSHPRVAYLLTGDSPLFQASIRNTLLGDLRRPLAQGEHDDHITEDLRQATLLAYELYDSIVPQNHRCLIGPMDPATRAELFVRELQPSLVTSLKGYLDEKSVYGRQLIEALPDHYRHLLDVIDAVRGREGVPSHESGQDPLLGEISRRLWTDAIKRSALSQTTVEKLHKVLRFDPENQHTTLNGHGLAFSTEWSNVHEIPIEFRDTLESTALVRTQPRLTATFDGEPLPSRAVAALMLATDTASYSDGPYRRFVGPPPYATPARGRFCSVRFIDRASGRGVELGWPLPSWTTFWDFFDFCDRWAKRVDARKLLSLDELALDYVEILLEMSGRDGKRAKRDRLTALSTDVERLFVDPKADSPYRDWAFRGAPLLRDELSGLSEGLRKAWMADVTQKYKDDLLQASLLREKHTYARVFDLDGEITPSVDQVMRDLKLREDPNVKQRLTSSLAGPQK